MIPKHEKIRRGILSDIKSGVHLPGDKIKSEHELCKVFDASRSTVRKTLNELVAQGILKRVQGLGTFVDEAALEKKDASQKKVILILPTIIAPFIAGLVSEVMIGIGDILSRDGYSFIGIAQPQNEEQIDDFLRNVTSENPLGIICAFYFGVDIGKELKALNIPVVFLDMKPNNYDFDLVIGDDFESARYATRYLYNKGCRKIGYYSVWNDQISTNQLRKSGVQREVKELGLPFEESLFYSSSNEIEILQDRSKNYYNLDEAKRFLQNNPNIDGIVCMTDDAALIVFAAAQSLGLAIPGDFSIVGYGNFEHFGFFQLDSFEQHLDNYGREAAKIILQRLKNELPNGVQKTIIPFDLIIAKKE